MTALFFDASRRTDVPQVAASRLGGGGVRWWAWLLGRGGTGSQGSIKKSRGSGHVKKESNGMCERAKAKGALVLLEADVCPLWSEEAELS